MRTPVSRFEIVAGGFLFAVCVIAVLALFASARKTNVADFFRERITVTAVADDAYGATVGSPVKVRDVEVGSVTDVSLVDDPSRPGKPVRIQMRLSSVAAPYLADRTIAIIVRPPFGSGMPPFGTSNVELRSAGERPLGRGAVIEAQGEDSMVATFAKMRGDVLAIREEFVATLKSVHGTLDDLKIVTDMLAHGRGVAGRMLTDDETAEAVRGLIGDMRGATVGLKNMTGDVKVAAAKAPAFLEGATGASADVRKLLARVEAATQALPAILASVERTMASAEELAATLKVATSNAPELARKVDSSLDETNRLVEAAQQNFLLRGTMPERAPLRTGAEVRAEPRAVEPPAREARGADAGAP